MSGRREHDIVLWEKGARLGSFAFNHRLIWRAVLSDVNPLRRQVMHREAARSLERSFGEDADRWCELLTFHYIEAADWERAMVHLRQACHGARAVLAFDTARHYLRKTVAVLDRLAGAAHRPEEEERWRQERERATAALAELKTS